MITFFFLHSEPEVALGLFKRKPQSNLCNGKNFFSSASGDLLDTKIHPKTFSYERSMDQESELIPNVYYSPPEASTNDLIDYKA